MTLHNQHWLHTLRQKPCLLQFKSVQITVMNLPLNLFLNPELVRVKASVDITSWECSVQQQTFFFLNQWVYNLQGRWHWDQQTYETMSKNAPPGRITCLYGDTKFLFNDVSKPKSLTPHSFRFPGKTFSSTPMTQADISGDPATFYWPETPIFNLIILTVEEWLHAKCFFFFVCFFF